MMSVILHLYDRAREVVARQVPISKLLATGLFDKLVKMKYDVPNDDLSKLDEYSKEIDTVMDGLLR